MDTIETISSGIEDETKEAGKTPDIEALFGALIENLSEIKMAIADLMKLTKSEIIEEETEEGDTKRIDELKDEEV